MMRNATHVHEAVRAIWLAVRRAGLCENEWGYTVLPPGCGKLPEVAKLTDEVCALVGEHPSEAEPVQLLLRLPDERSARAAAQYEAHVDRTPDGALYRRVVGCCLTPAPNGTVVTLGTTIGYAAGEVFGWPGAAVHQGLLNSGATPRLTAYWRFR